MPLKWKINETRQECSKISAQKNEGVSKLNLSLWESNIWKRYQPVVRINQSQKRHIWSFDTPSKQTKQAELSLHVRNIICRAIGDSAHRIVLYSAEHRRALNRREGRKCRDTIPTKRTEDSYIEEGVGNESSRHRDLEISKGLGIAGSRYRGMATGAGNQIAL